MGPEGDSFVSFEMLVRLSEPHAASQAKDQVIEIKYSHTIAREIILILQNKASYIL